MKINKPLILWFVLIVAWSFGVPGARPILDVAVSVSLYFLTKSLNALINK